MIIESQTAWLISIF